MINNVMTFVAILILASMVVSYAKRLGIGGGGAGLDEQEGFQGNEDTLSKVNNSIAEQVTDLDDQLLIPKYKKDYKKLVNLSKDYLEGMRVSALFDLKQIDPTSKSSDEERTRQCVAFAKKINAFTQGIASLEDVDIAQDRNTSSWIS